MARPCDRPGCGAVGEIALRWVSGSEEQRQLDAELVGDTVSVRTSVFVGCVDHAREVWVALSGTLRTYRRIA